MPFHTEDTIDDESYNLWICASYNKNQTIMNELINACRPINVAKVAGSGNKIINILD
jgi:hypothetical protein